MVMRDDPDFMHQITLDLAAREAARRILGVAENASSEQLKKAYRIAAKQHHPDHNASSPEADRIFKLIRCAYELLAFDKACHAFPSITTYRHVPEDDNYRLENAWGYFCWWREKFFG